MASDSNGLQPAGLASGINSSLSRLLGMAVLGPIVLFSYGQSLKERTPGLDVSPDAGTAVREQAANPGNGEVLSRLSSGMAIQVQGEFVGAFRTVSYVCAGVVWLSMLVAFFLLDSRGLESSSSPTAAGDAGFQFVQRTAQWHQDVAPDKTLVPLLSASEFVRDQPDAHWHLTDGENRIVGRCSLWWNETPAYQDHHVGLIGHYFVVDGRAASKLLQHACEQLHARGCTLAVGPMDRDIWRTYRLMTEFGTEPPIVLEPTNPQSWPGHWSAAGFEPIAEYFSSLNEDIRSNHVPVSHIEERLRHRNIRVRPIDPTRFESELRNLFAIIPTIFRENLFFTSIDEETFMDLYRPMQEMVVPDLVMIAEDQGRPVGFVFCLPDVLQAKRGAAIDTIIVKTVGVLPGQKYAGLGNLLLERAGFVARELGYKRLIHMLVRDVGYMRKMSGRSARQIRAYTLFGRDLRS